MVTNSIFSTRRRGFRWLRVMAMIVVLVMAVVQSACGVDEGRDLAEPEEWQTTSTRPPPPTSAPDQMQSSSGVVLSSPDFSPGDDIPVDATCAGRNVFPNLTWSTLPGYADELAVTLTDQTDPENPILLWLMAGISPTLNELPSGFQPDGAFETLNDYGNHGYGTPCLESFQTGLRDIQFRLYILDAPSTLSEGAPGNEAWDELEVRQVESASLLARVNANSG